MAAAGRFLAAVRRRLRPPRRLSFTREGRLLVLVAIGVGFAAINTGNNLLYLLLGWLLSFILASGFLSEATMRGLRVRRRDVDLPKSARRHQHQHKHDERGRGRPSDLDRLAAVNLRRLRV